MEHGLSGAGATKGADPATFPLPIELLQSMRVSDGFRTYLVEAIDADFVRVRGCDLWIPVRELSAVTGEVNVGQRVPEYLRKKVPADAHSTVVAAATIVAAFVGYPRTGKRDRRPGGPLDRVWTDHVALANGDPPAE